MPHNRQRMADTLLGTMQLSARQYSHCLQHISAIVIGIGICISTSFVKTGEPQQHAHQLIGCTPCRIPEVGLVYEAKNIYDPSHALPNMQEAALGGELQPQVQRQLDKKRHAMCIDIAVGVTNNCLPLALSDTRFAKMKVKQTAVRSTSAPERNSRHPHLS